MKRILFSIVCIYLISPAFAIAESSDKDAELFQAAGNGRIEAVKTALDRGANPNVKNDAGETALWVASWQGHTEVVELLLENGADVNAKRTDDGITALWIASQEGHTEVVELLLENGAEVDIQRTDIGITALFIASQRGHSEVVKLLLENGAEVDAKRTDIGITALWIASQEGHTEVVKILLENGAEADVKNTNGVSALDVASQQGHTEVVELLSGNGAETDADAESPESDSKQAMDFEQFQQEYNTIVEIVETGEYGKARKGFKELLNKEVETQNTEELKELRSSIWNNLGAMALEQGDIEEAERALEKATELNPENESAYNNLGALLLRQGHYEEAIEAYEKVLHINPQHIGTINDLATLLIEVRQYSRAGDLLASAIDMDITNERSLKLLARMYAENNVKKDSEKVRAEWLRKAGPKPEDRARVAFQYLAFGQPEHAKAILKLIREENPGWDGLETLEGRILAAENKWKEAIEKLETGLEKNPRDLSVRNDLVTVLLRSGKTEEAVEVAEEGTRKSPDKAVSWYLKGLVYEAKGDIGTAKSAYDQAIEVDPGHTQALLNRAVIVIKEAESNEDAPEAVELLEKALSSDPNNQKVIYNLGRVLVISEIDYKRGIRLLARAGKGRGEAAQKARDFIDRIYEGVKGMEETTTDRPVYKTGLEFDGKKSYVELSAPYTAVPNTFEAWINVPESVPDDQRVGVITGSYPETNNINFEVHQTGNPRIWWNDGEIDVQINEEDVRTGEWLHFAVVRNPADDEFRFYINGEVVESVVGTGEDVVPESPQIIGGDWRLDDGPIFHGRIGELRVWSQPKTEKEIKTLMDAELAGDEEGLLGYWIFDEGEGGIAYDHSRFENHGRIKGATWYEE